MNKDIETALKSQAIFDGKRFENILIGLFVASQLEVYVRFNRCKDISVDDEFINVPIGYYEEAVYVFNKLQLKMNRLNNYVFSLTLF